MLLRLLALFSLIISLMPVYSQNNNHFEKEWKKIDTLPNKEFITASTQKKMEQLLDEAIKVQNKPYILKAYSGIVSHILNRNFSDLTKYDEAYQYLQKIKKEQKDITCELIEILEARVLIDYRSNQFFSIINQEEYDSTNTLTKHTIQQLDEKIIRLYQNILNNADLFGKISITEYKPVLTNSTDPQVTPYLWDAINIEIFDGIRAISENNTQPSSYRLIDTAVLAAYPAFIDHSFDHIEFEHLKDILKIYQQILKHYQNSGNPELLAYFDYHRLKFANQKLVAANKSTLYYQALHEQFKKFPNTRYAAWYGLEMGNFFYKSGVTYDPFNNTAPQYDLKKALEIYKKIEPYFKTTRLDNRFTYQYNDIIQINAELVLHPNQQPNKPILATLTYKNIAELKLKVYTINNFNWSQLTNAYYGENQSGGNFNKKLISTKNYKLKDFGDHQSHKTDIILDALPVGLYYVEYEIENKKTGFPLSISNINFLHTNDKLLVVSNIDGSPIADANIQLWKSNWNYQTQENEYTIYKTLVTDNQGLAGFDEKKYNSFQIEIIANKEHFYSFQSINLISNTTKEREYKSTKFYLDRAIYRPGQTVFFKGISFEKKEGNEPQTVAEKNVKVEVYDINDNIIFTKTYQTNEFGSFDGEFTLPNTLGGSFYIKASEYLGTKYFRVEEYKRPKFKVKFDEHKNAYQLNDSIHIIGNAMAYAGYPIQEAKVNYTVKRMVRLPRWRNFYMPIRNVESIILTTGDIQTDKDGKFVVPFKAIPTNDFEKNLNPIFTYEVSVTVTDLSGETHDEEISIDLSWNKYDINFDFNENFDIKKINQLPISIQNFYGEKLEVNANLEIVGIQPPSGIYHHRDPNAGFIDVVTVDSISFKKQFPHEIFYREHEPSYWKETGFRKSINFTSNKEGKIDLSNQGIKNGWYKLTVTIPGENQQPTTYVQFYEGKPVSFYYSIESVKDKNSYEYNEKANFTITSNLPSNQKLINTLYEAQNLQNLEIESNKTSLNKTLELKKLPQSITFATLFEGRVYKTSQVVIPLNPASKLDIEIIKKGDTLYPGSQNKFELKISGNIKNAEILTGMYDASLDVFAQNYWESLASNNTYPIVANWYTPSKNYYNNLNFIRSKDLLIEKKLTELARFNFLKQIELYEVGAKGYGLAKRMVAAAPGVNIAADSAVPLFEENESQSEKKQEEIKEESIRDNFNETAFFFPRVKTDENGNASVEFTIPESLTEWKWMIMAHNSDLGFAYKEDRVVTQKNLMIETNVPRFLRQGDSIVYIAKLINLTQQNVKAKLEYSSIKTATGKSIEIFDKLTNSNITIPANSTIPIEFKGVIPVDLLEEIAITIKVSSDQAELKDAVKDVLPILPNSAIITGARNFYFSGNGKYDFRFPELKSTLENSTLPNAPVMISMNLNPSWEVINALPYIGAVKYESSNEFALQIYANALAAKIIKDNPSIREQLDRWRKELKENNPKGTLEDLAFQAISSESSPWLAQAKDEKAHQAAIVNLFDSTLIKTQISNAFEKLRLMQRYDGGFTWFKDGQYSSTYITTNILILLGELIQWNAIKLDVPQEQMVNNALNYLDNSLKMNYKNDSAKYVSELNARYLYMRNLFAKPIPKDVQQYYDAYLNTFYKSWDKLSLYGEAKMGIVAEKNKNHELSKRILTSLKDRATISDTLGMYWKENTSGYLWSQNQLLVQASLIEFFELMGEDVKTIHQMQKWLLRLKETNRWENAASTANIIKAFFVKNPVDFNHNPAVKINFNKEKFDFTKSEKTSGYIKIYKELNKKDIKKDEISVTIKESSPQQMIWGNIIWQYQLPFEQIQPNDNELKINKNIFFLENNTWKEVKSGQVLKVGTKIKVVMRIETDRPMEYIHIQDDRAANMEPTEQMSHYRYADRIWYYQTMKDANTHFFIDNLPAGKSEIEYECFITQTGSYYNGNSIIESYYAPNYRNQSSTIKLHSK